MARLAAPLLALALLLAASGPLVARGEPLDDALERARAEQRAAQTEATRLERAAESARTEAARLRARQFAAAQAINAAEARITAADMELRLAAARLDLQRRKLRQEQQPLASLLAGLVLMAERPPLLAIADRGSTDELVRVRLLLDATLPVIRRRTAALSASMGESRRLGQAAAAARSELLRGREELLARRNRFAELERQALQSAALAGGQALSAGDVAIVAEEDVEQLSSAGATARAAAALAAALAQTGPAPPRPVPPDSRPPTLPFAYRLPAAAPVTDGFGAVSATGIRSRGITLATARGTAVAAPAGGIVRFSGPFRDYDGIMIIDHGRGWMSLLINVASQLRPGARLRGGEPIGRALGPLGVELSQNGRRVSPALIAGSSETLSNKAQGG